MIELRDVRKRFGEQVVLDGVNFTVQEGETVALLGMAGIWSEIYVLVVPSLSPRSIPLGWVEILVTAGFLGAFWLCSYPGLQMASVAAMEPIGESH